MKDRVIPFAEANGFNYYQPGDDYFGIDTSLLPPNSIVPDSSDPNHFGINGLSPDQIKAALISGSRGTFPK